MGSLLARSTPWTPHAALSKLAQLKQEKERLSDEMRRCERRIEQIEARLEETGEMEQWLYKMAGDAQESPGTAPIESGQADGKKKPPDVPAGLREMLLRY
jgi:hypothetical protein